MKKIRSNLDANLPVCRITLNAPPGNVIDLEMIAELGSAIDDISNQRDLKMVFFEGDGPHFSYGASVPDHVREKVGEFLPRFDRLILRILESEVPWIAMVQGQCLGGAAELVMACDMVVMAEDAKIGLPEIKLGVFPPAGVVLLPALVGATRANEIIFSGRALGAQEAKSIGLVNHITSAATLGSWAEAYFRDQINPKSAAALRLAKRATRKNVVDHVRSNMGAVEKMYLEETMSTYDANEGIAAFLSKRPPVWENR